MFRIICHGARSGLRQLSVRYAAGSQTKLGVIRLFSSRKRRFQLDALPFTVAPSDAYAKFERWANDEQGLGTLLSIGKANITASFAPYWYFDLNIRFLAPGQIIATPEPFRSAFPNPPNGVIHIPGLAAYAGFSYRRSLIDPVHNTTPTFLKKDIVPFGQWMLEPLNYGSEKIDIFPDPWNATRERAFSVIYDELNGMANEQHSGEGKSEVRLETERLSSRRIYMPTYIVEYTILGITYQAVISGCDASIQVSGVSHTTFFSAGSEGNKVLEGASSFLSSLPQRVMPAAAGTLQFFGLRPFIAVGQLAVGVVSRIAMKFHILGILGGALVAWRKLLRPYIDARTATAEWERQRDHEAQSSDSIHEDSFRDYGHAKAYFERNQKGILKSLSGEEGRCHDQENNEWYTQWEAWAREQWEQAQRENSRAQAEWQREQQHNQQQQGRTYEQYQQSTQQKQQRQYKQAQKPDEFTWDFDANDPWSVLGVPQKSSKDIVSKAFRREMLKHHPDLQSQSSEKEKRRATERSKIISDAYRKVKLTFKK